MFGYEGEKEQEYRPCFTQLGIEKAFLSLFQLEYVVNLPRQVGYANLDRLYTLIHILNQIFHHHKWESLKDSFHLEGHKTKRTLISFSLHPRYERPWHDT